MSGQFGHILRRVVEACRLEAKHALERKIEEHHDQQDEGKATSIAAKPGTPVPLSAFQLSQPETERLFSIFDEDYHISRYFHFRNEHGHKYSINGEEATHVVIDPAIRLAL